MGKDRKVFMAGKYLKAVDGRWLKFVVCGIKRLIFLHTIKNGNAVKGRM